MNDIQTIREALDFFYSHYLNNHGHNQTASDHAHKADEAIDRVEQRTLPELPEDYNYIEIREYDDGVVEAYVSGLMNAPSGRAEGQTPRAAVLAAIEKIGDAK